MRAETGSQDKKKTKDAKKLTGGEIQESPYTHHRFDCHNWSIRREFSNIKLQQAEALPSRPNLVLMWACFYLNMQTR